MVINQFRELQPAICVVLQNTSPVMVGKVSISAYPLGVPMLFLIWIVLMKQIMRTSLYCSQMSKLQIPSFSSIMKSSDVQILDHYTLTIEFQIYLLCNKLPNLKVEEYKRPLAKLCAHAWHFPTSNTALVSIVIVCHSKYKNEFTKYIMFLRHE